VATDSTIILPIPDAAFSIDILNEGDLKAQRDPASASRSR